jgi:hypothetical protein
MADGNRAAHSRQAEQRKRRAEKTQSGGKKQSNSRREESVRRPTMIEGPWIRTGIGALSLSVVPRRSCPTLDFLILPHYKSLGVLIR